MSVGRQVTAGRDKTLTAAADLSADAKRYTFVKVSAAQTVNTAGAGEVPIGLQQNKPESGEGCVVRLCACGGSSLVKLGETVVAGDALKVGVGGVAMKAAAGEKFYAIANEGVTYTGVEIIEAILQQGIA